MVAAYFESIGAAGTTRAHSHLIFPHAARVFCGKNNFTLFGTPTLFSSTLRPVNQTQIIQGRPFGAQELAQVQALLTDHPDWSRRRLSLQLAQLWAWRTPTGQLKDMAARTLLLKLEARGWIQLPTRRRAPSKRLDSQLRPQLEPSLGQEPLRGSLDSLLPLNFTEVSTPAPHSQRSAVEV